ncbi:MAG TPA: SpvB/TcaC N-terminal domain-containing protein, partial [Thermoanaerobaculia bacterium]|nr:SpvB/TcaC N-terminal domain-containing protein [Thermoanaerobaculia bacterium]
MRHRRLLGASLVAILSLVGWLFGQPADLSSSRNDSPLRRVVPLQVDLLPAQSAGDPWRLFDRDVKSGLTGTARVRLRLDRARALAAIGVYGPADGQLQVLARRGSDWVPLQELDLRGLGAGWHRTELAELVTARALVVEWRPFSEGAALPEIEIWAAGSVDERRTATAVPQGSAFLVQLDAEPAAFSRAFLTYEIEGVSHWAGVRRSINGLPAQGGFEPVESKDLSTQTEEINPRWLVRGLNEVRFEKGDLPYSVRNVRIELVEDGGRDGHLSGWDGQAQPAMDLRFHAPSQPYALELTVAGRPEGELVVDSLQGDGSAVTASRPVDLGSLEPGLNRIALDGPADALGVRLTWRGAGGGAISEASVLASPTGKARPALVLSAGEETEAGAYLRGFADPMAGLSVDGKPTAIEQDGAFGVFVPRTGPAGEAWQVTLAAAFSDGTRLRRTVRFGQDRGGDPDLANVKEEQAAPGEARSIRLAGASLDVPPGALAQKVAISMRRLAGGDLPELDSGMTNVTAEGGGFRMGPHGLRFREPVQLTLPYDASRIPAGMTADDIQTFYFDEAAGRWFPIPRVEVGAGVVVSATDHFTDFIAATLALPDEPAGESLTPNSLDELATADPSAGIDLIEAPEAGPTGNAGLSFPITVPPGRHGLEPELEVTYDSGNPNGWLGVGWDLPIPAIEVSTLFGVPRYDPAHESETYLLDGQQLAPVADPGSVRIANRTFTRRVEGDFDRIVRRGSGPADHWWEVTDQDGVRYLYGRTEQARLRDPRTGNTFRWNLEQVVDPRGNTVDYTYASDSDDSGEPWTQVYPARIDYTGSPQGGAFYQVRFNLDAGDRPDRLSTGMPGFKVVTRRRLGSVEVLAGGALVRRYVFSYKGGGEESFFKSLLDSVAVQGADSTELYHHSFEYFRQERQGDAFAGFGAPESWGGLSGSRDATNVQSWSAGGHGFAGLGPPECQPHAGIQLGGGGGETTTRSSFFDVDGDGLPDRIDEDGNVDRNAYDPATDQGAFSRLSYPGTEAFSHSSDWNVDFGAGVHAEAGITAGLDASFAWVHSSEDRAVADVNGDLRPDLVSTAGGFAVRVNTGSGFAERSDWSGFGGVDLTAPGEEDEVLAKFRLSDALRKLKLPAAGRVSIGGAVQRKQAGGDGARVRIYRNGGLVWQRTVAADDVSACEPAPNDGCGGGLALDVQAGDELFFLAGSVRDTSADDLLWSPRVTYLDRDADAREPWGPRVHVFDAAEDFRLAGFRGAGWQAPADGVVRVIGGIAKQSTSDDVTVRVVRTRGVIPETLYSRTLAAAETGTFDEIPSIPVLTGDLLFFGIAADTPVDPVRVAWTPTVSYESGGESLDPSLRSMAAQVSQAVPRLLPTSEPTGSWTAPEAGSYPLSVTWDPSGSGPVVLYVQGLHRLFDRRVVTASRQSFSLALDLAAGEPVFVSVVADYPWDGGSLTASIGSAPIPVNLRYRDSAGDVLSGGWHGWYYGEWNGNRDFNPAGLTPPADEDTQPDFVSGVPRWEGIEGFRAPAWTATGFDLHLAEEGVKPSRQGSNVTANFDRAAGGGGGLSVLRETAGRTASVGVSAGVGLSLSAGSTDAQLDLLDINGDGYADQVSGEGVRFSNGRDGFGPLQALSGLGGAVRSIDDATVGTTIGLGINYVKKNGSGKAQAALNTLPSVGSTVSLSQVRTDLLDVNGDGLPDRVAMTPGSGSLEVQLNLGYRFGAPEVWPLPHWDGAGSARCQDVVDYVASEVAGALSALDTLDGISFTRSSAGHAGIAIGPFGGGVTTTLARTLVDLADVNGDGLLDRVAKEEGDPYFRVQLNLGDGWAPEERWTAPDWTVQPGSGYDPGLFRCLDALSFQGSLGGNGSAGAPICIPLVPPTPVVGLQIEISVQAEGGEGGLQLSLQDLDGDGLADHVLKRAGDGNVWVRRNEARKVNLLSTVHRPLGGTVRLDYRRQGNHADMPYSQWVLASATEDDGRGNAYETRFDYFNGGYFDRAERESYGYARVLTTRPDGSTIDRRYHNRDFYQRHLLVQEAVADASGRLFQVETTTYEPVQISAVAAFPAMTREETRFYEGTGSPRKITATAYEYDALGNVVAWRDFADEGTDDDLVAAATYHVDPAAWIVQPASIEIRDGAGRLMRRRDAAYDAYGDVVRLEQTLAGGSDPATGIPYSGTDNAVWTYAYDALGNLASSTDPTGYTRSFAYDPAALTHPVELRDSFGYVNRKTWDLRFGEPAEEIDQNGASLRRVYDPFGRIAEAYGPYDAAGSPALRFEYAPAARPAYALAHHKDTTRPDPIDTAVFLDGLGRTIQTKGDTEVDAGSGTSTRTGMRVSGRLAFDSLGRVASEGQPVFDTQAADRFVDAAAVNPTTFDLDVLDRVRRVRLPNGAETRLDYGFAELDGVQRFATTRTDPNGRATRFFHDMAGETLGVEQTNRGKKLLTRYAYDAMSQLLSATDARGNVTRLAWDTLGRNVLLDSPDAGRTELRYDRGGNLGARITANLAARGRQIRYLRTFHRLDRVDYPDMPDVVYAYGAPGASNFRAGRVATVADESGTEELFYGRLGEVVRRTKTATALNGGSPKGPFTTTYQFDGFGRLLAVGYPDGEVVTYGFDAEGRVKSAAGVSRGVRTDYLTHLGYDEHGDKVRALQGNGVETRWTYDPLSRHLARLTTLERGGREIQDLVYDLDKTGTILGLANDVPVPAPSQYGGPTSQRFRYDDLYQLVAADGAYQSAPNKRANYTLALAYDDLGNITSKNQLHQITSGNKAQTQQKTTYDQAYAYGGPRPHAATRIGTRTFQYDLDGNQVGWQEDANGTRRTLVWNEEDRLAAVSDNGQTTRFLYDADGTRTNKAGPNGETIYVDPWFSVRNGAIGSRHVWADGMRVATKVVPDASDPSSEKVYFYQADHLGSTQFVTDSRGLAWQHLEYLPSGETWVDERSEKQSTPWQLSGKEMDEETGLSYFGFRYYDARQSQWISADPILDELLDTRKLARSDLSDGGFHLPGHVYGYVGNDPTDLVDPNGLGKTRRSQFVGSTPSKNSSTGRSVRQRMAKGGQLKNYGKKNEQVLVLQGKNKQKAWRKLDKTIHMG